MNWHLAIVLMTSVSSAIFVAHTLISLRRGYAIWGTKKWERDVNPRFYWLHIIGFAALAAMSIKVLFDFVGQI